MQVKGEAAEEAGALHQGPRLQWQDLTQSYRLKESLRNFNQERDAFFQRSLWEYMEAYTTGSRESPVVIVQGRDKDHQKQGRSAMHGKGKINQEEIFNMQDVQGVVNDYQRWAQVFWLRNWVVNGSINSQR